MLQHATPAITRAWPASGVFGTPQTVQLFTDRQAVIYYTTDGSEPTLDSPRYTDPVRLEGSLQLRYFSVDPYGNREAAREERYEIQPQAPTIMLRTISGFDVEARRRWCLPGRAIPQDTTISSIGQSARADRRPARSPARRSAWRSDPAREGQADRCHRIAAWRRVRLRKSCASRHVLDQNPSFLQFVERCGLTPGSQLIVESRDPERGGGGRETNRCAERDVRTRCGGEDPRDRRRARVYG